jgi:hypothetical protein
LFYEFQAELNNFDKANVSLKRANEDKCSNSYGYKFIDFLLANNLYILNGRTTGNTNGNLTCKNSSTVDYFVCSSNLFTSVHNMFVLDFCDMCSDVHNPISLRFNFKVEVVSYKSQQEANVKLWDTNNSVLFYNNLNDSKINQIIQNLIETESSDSISQTKMDEIAENISEFFVESAKTSFGYHDFNVKSINNKNVKARKGQPWFNSECKIARKNFHRSKFLYKLRKSEENKRSLKRNSKIYKTTINKSLKDFKINNATKLKNMKNCKPKQFWKLLNGKKKGRTHASLENLYNYFKNINFVENEDENILLDNETTSEINTSLNSPILICEIEKAIKSLKNNKASGIDQILNEHLKYSFPKIKEMLLKLFNIIFTSGLVPSMWTIGTIIPIYKNKGDPKEPSNYRPITLLSCLGKLFTAILNNRLQKFADDSELLNKFQAGFRKGYSTVDNMFILNSLIEFLKSKKKVLYCAFVDLKSAFDTVWRNGLWSKLVLQNVNGNFLQIIKSIYKNAKSCLKVNGVISDYFPSNIGVRQGENLSPLLFSLYLNDLHDFFVTQNQTNGIFCNTHTSDESILMFVKLFILLYADDTVIIAESAQSLQYALDTYAQYCNNWKLMLNVTKTKILIFSRGRQQRYQFTYNNEQIEIVNEYNYLGILFSRSGSFYNAKKEIAKQATKTMYSLLKQSKHLCLPIDTQIDLFMRTVKPVLLYGCEIWGYGNVEIIERVQLKFLKIILNVKSSTPNSIVYGETGVKPLSIDIKQRMISFWCKLVNERKLSSEIYSIVLSNFKYLNNHKFLWIEHVKNIFFECGLMNIWESHEFNNSKWLTLTIKQKLSDIFINEWYSNIENQSKCRSYKLFKHNFGFEKYLIETDYRYLKHVIKFRTKNHKLPIETGSWIGIPLEDRRCTLCHIGIGDEFHYLLECNALSQLRQRYIKPLYYRSPNIIYFDSLMNINAKNKSEYRKFCIFTKSILQLFK